MTYRSLFLVLPLTLFPAACASTRGAGTADAKAATAGDHDGEDGDEKGDSKADKLQKKERALAYARLELKIARQGAEADERECKSAVEDAERELSNATLDRDHFVQVSKDLELAKSKLELDHGAQQIEESRQELGELESMYKQEDLAALTKELVLTRGRKKLEMAQRNFELDQKEAAALRDFEQPKKLRDLEHGVTKAERELREAKAKQAKTATEKELSLLKAEHEVDELEKAVAKMKAKDAQP